MKYQNLAAFEKHLQQAAKVHLSRVFLIVSSCSYERKKIYEKVLAAVQLKERDLALSMEEASEGDLEERISGLNTSSLLGGTQLLYLDGIDKLKKNALAPLGEYIAHPSPFAYLVLGANAAKNLSDLYTQGKKELIVCDLSEEKPWDRKERLKRFLIDEAAKAGKRWQGEAVDYLLENVGLQLSSLDQELAKLLAYCGERGELTLKDVRSLCFSEKNSTLWQLAEAIIWSEEPPRIDETADLSLLLPLVSLLRQQLQQGMVLAILLERGATHTEINHHLPTVKASALDKMVPAARGRTSAFFRRALDLLFEIELMAKNSSFEPSFILDLFIAKITLFKKKHALSFSQSSR
jgi:DNA polymerase-3 subunit delta